MLRDRYGVYVSGLLMFFLLADVNAPAEEPQNMIGRQSQNEGVLVLPAPPKLTIDGDLSEWDWSGRIWVFADSALRSRYSVEAAALWDKDNLYLAAKWKDPSPMYSTVDPDFLADEGWKSDSWQIRLRTDKISHVTLWYFTPGQMPVFHVQYGESMTRPFGGPGTFWVAREKGTVLGRGIEMAYKKDEDGKGFAQEVKIPWRIICQAPDWKAGDTFQMGCEFLWGDPSGRTWPVHRYADNMQPGVTSREFYWTAWKSWGTAKLVAEGPVPVRTYVGESFRIEGTVPIRADIPKDASSFTLVIEDSRGGRVRNLAGGCDPLDYTVQVKGRTRTVEVKWDCLDDRGTLVQPGAYSVRGLTHKGLGAEYEMCFYNPGTPPWGVHDGSGSWGADHSAPNNVAAAGDWMVVTWGVAEGGSGIIGIDPSGRKRWGDRRGVGKVTADENSAYAYVTGWYTSDTICRFSARDGSYQPFVLDGTPRRFDLPLNTIFADEPPGSVVGMAVHGNELVLSMTKGKLAVLDAASAKLLNQIDAPGVGDVTFGPQGKLYALVDGRLNAVDVETATFTPIATPGLGKAAALAADPDGNVVIADAGPDSQAKAFSPAGKLIYTCGKKGGRPIRGTFDEEAMVKMSSIAVDTRGRVWVTENWNYPRRVSVWGRDGRLVRDYIGNTGYSGTCCYLHDQNPELAYCGPIEFKLDRKSGTWKLTRVLWVPDPGKGECFEVPTGSHVHPQRFTSDASGKTCEYLYTHDPRDGGGQVIYMERNGRWQPVAAVCLVGHISGRINRFGIIEQNPSGEMQGLNCYDGCFWNDANSDGKVQRAECVIVPSKNPGKVGTRGTPPLDLGNGWGGRISLDLTFYTDGIVRYRPVRFTQDGAPVYSPESAQRVGVDDRGDIVPVPGEDRLICLSWIGYAGPTRLTGINPEVGKVDWYYPNPYPGVHGSHRAPMPTPGLLIGPLKTVGSASVNGEGGRVFLMRGNLGQDFYMTTDGLFIGAMFQDCRLPNEALPERESMLKGMPMEAFSGGGEPFNGWFGKQADGKIRTTVGLAREACMILEIKGLESIRRFRADGVTLDPATIVKADADNAARAKAPAEPKRYSVKKLAKAPTIDGNANDWQGVPGIRIARQGQPDNASAGLAHDGTNLYVLFQVNDPSPWRNEGKDYTRLFKTGDAVDLHLCVDPGAKPHRNPQAGDLRIVFSQLNNEPVAVLMAPVDKAAAAAQKVRFTSPVGTKVFDRVEVLPDARTKVRKTEDRYVVEAAIPLKALGLALEAGMVLRGDVGFISSDARGVINTARTYWANPFTNLVSDLPLEAWLYPDNWGELAFE